MKYDFRYVEFRGEVYYVPRMIRKAAIAIAATVVMAAPIFVVFAAYFTFA